MMWIEWVTWSAAPKEAGLKVAGWPVLPGMRKEKGPAAIQAFGVP